MEEFSGKVDLNGNLLRLNSVRAPESLKTSFSARSGSRNSPSFRRLQSSRVPRRDFKASSGRLRWIRSNRVVFWLLLITLWAYIGFHVQSRWAHSDHRKKEFVGYKGEGLGVKNQLNEPNDSVSLGFKTANSVVKEQRGGEQMEHFYSSDSKYSMKKLPETVKCPLRKKSMRMLKKVTPKAPILELNTKNVSDDVIIPKRNSSFGLMYGPFGEIEDRIFEWSPNKRKGTCDRKRKICKDLRKELVEGKSLGVPDGVLMNGKGPYRYNNTLIPAVIDYETINVQPGKTYRFRIHNVRMFTCFRVQPHNLLLTETEGSYTVQQNYSNLDIFVGQSYSFLITMDQNASSDNYIVASARFVSGSKWDKVVGVAILHYSNSKGKASARLPDPPNDVHDKTYSMNQARSIRKQWSSDATAE